MKFLSIVNIKHVGHLYKIIRTFYNIILVKLDFLDLSRDAIVVTFVETEEKEMRVNELSLCTMMYFFAKYTASHKYTIKIIIIISIVVPVICTHVFYARLRTTAQQGSITSLRCSCHERLLSKYSCDICTFL